MIGYLLAQVLVPELVAPPTTDLLALVGTNQATGTRKVESQITIDPFLGESPTVQRSVLNLHKKVTAEVKPQATPPQRTKPNPIPISIAQRKATLNASSWELSSALRALSQETGVNITLAHTEDPKITVQLREMPLGDILRVLAALTKLKFIQVGDSYVVATEEVLKSSFPREYAEQYPAQINPEEEVLKSYTVSHVSAAQAVASLTSLLLESEKIGIAVGPASEVPEITVGSSSSISSQSSSGSAGGGGSTSGGTQSGSNQVGNGRTILLRGPESKVKYAIKLLKQIDAARPQVNISVKIMDASKDALKDLGLSWTFGNVTLTERTPTGIAFETIDRGAQTFAGVISALERNGKTKILAEPNISVLDGQSAYILIGDRINYPVVTGLTPNNTPIYDIKEEKVGVYFQVGASITEEGEIIMNLYPQVSTITGFLNVNGASYPQVSTREARTTMRITSGETIAVAGLIREEEIESWQKVPILGDIPLLGELFKKKRTSRTASQVLIFITPIINGYESGSSPAGNPR
jgi:type II secretory pathway component GspD/PulD (secretin)